MNFLEFWESFNTGIHAKGIGYTEIYKNPTKDELKAIRKDSVWEGSEQYFRIGVDENFDLYCWKVEVLHDEVENKLNKKFPAKFSLRDKSAIWSETKPDSKNKQWRIDNYDKIEQTIQKYFPEVTIF